MSALGSGIGMEQFRGDTLGSSENSPAEIEAARYTVERMVPEGRDRGEIFDALGISVHHEAQPVPTPRTVERPQPDPEPKPEPEPRKWSAFAGYTDAGPARTHVQQLVDAGMTQTAIAEAACWSDSGLSRLLHGDFRPGRPPVEAIKAVVSARLLAVELELPEPPPKRVAPCPPGRAFTLAGYRVGRCATCGRLVATHIVAGGKEQLMAHPPLELDDDVSEAA